MIWLVACSIDKRRVILGIPHARLTLTRFTRLKILALTTQSVHDPRWPLPTGRCQLQSNPSLIIISHYNVTFFFIDNCCQILFYTFAICLRFVTLAYLPCRRGPAKKEVIHG